VKISPKELEVLSTMLKTHHYDKGYLVLVKSEDEEAAISLHKKGLITIVYVKWATIKVTLNHSIHRPNVCSYCQKELTDKSIIGSKHSYCNAFCWDKHEMDSLKKELIE